MAILSMRSDVDNGVLPGEPNGNCSGDDDTTNKDDGDLSVDQSDVLTRQTSINGISPGKAWLPAPQAISPTKPLLIVDDINSASISPERLSLSHERYQYTEPE